MLREFEKIAHRESTPLNTSGGGCRKGGRGARHSHLPQAVGGEKGQGWGGGRNRVRSLRMGAYQHLHGPCGRCKNMKERSDAVARIVPGIGESEKGGRAGEMGGWTNQRSHLTLTYN